MGNMSPDMIEDREAVSLADLARKLGLSRDQRRYMVDQGLVIPVRPVRKGPHGTQITPEDAERIERAVRIAAVSGVALVVVLKVLRALG